jgi:homoserine kinase
VKDGYAAIYPDETLPMDDIKFTSVNRIPPARGLGSSSAALVAGLAAGLALAGQGPRKAPDQAAPPAARRRRRGPPR